MKHPPWKAFLRVRPSMVMLEAGHRDARGSACGARCDRLRAWVVASARHSSAETAAPAPKPPPRKASAAREAAITAAAMAATPASEVAATTGNRLQRTMVSS